MRTKLGMVFGIFSAGLIVGMALTVKLEEKYIFRPLNAYFDLIIPKSEETEESEEETNGVSV